MQSLVKTSYDKKDVIVLLKDLSLEMKEMSTEEREKAIQNGVHYSEMLPKENEPTLEYEKLYEKALNDKKEDIAKGIAIVSEIMFNNTITKNNEIPVIISLARAGIPVGILMKRYIKEKYGIEIPHYAISIIRDKGIDENAMEYIYKECVEKGISSVKNFFFIDGWTGKGAIKNQLTEAVEQMKNLNEKWNDLKDDLYVLADPANITPFRGTKEDFLLPSACLNSTVSGLTSRTILNSFIDVKNGDFHGAVYFEKFENIDKSNDFLDIITQEFKNIKLNIVKQDILDCNTGMRIVNEICEKFNILDFKKVKPGIGETTRVLLRRIPWKVLINTSLEDSDIQHILELCKEKNIPYEIYPMGNYKVCGIIKELSADA